MKLQVYSEVGRLRKVMTHKPGHEVDEMPPVLMSELLFDDILFGPKAREEHDQFTRILESFGVENLDFQTLLRESLAVDRDKTEGLISLVCEREHLDPTLRERLLGMEAKELANALVVGLQASAANTSQDHFFDLNPIPNLLMSRDPQVVLGNGVIIGSMCRGAREREGILSQFVYSTHDSLRPNDLYFDYGSDTKATDSPQFGSLTLEGGDVLVLGQGIVAVGISERTMEPSIDLLADALRKLDWFKTLIMVRMPGNRSQMHLDTIFTQISENECLVYPPMLQEGYAETLSVCSIDLSSGTRDYGRRHPSFFRACKSAGLDLEPIACGGQGNYIQQTREQWTDGANSFALAPGLIVLYDRNTETLRELERHGYGVLSVEEFTGDADTYATAVLERGKKYVVCIPSSELSRARGGPRCMTMPLVRDAVQES